MTRIRIHLRFSLLALVAWIALASVPPYAQAEPEKVRLQFHFDEIIGNPCTGEAIRFARNRLFVLHYTRHDTTVSGTLELPQEEVKGVGSTGNRYAFASSSYSEFNVSIAADGSFTVISESTFRVSSQTSADTFLRTMVDHVTVKANGAPTATIAKDETVCPA